MTTRIVQYYPRALAGDGGMTGAVDRLAESLHRAGAAASVIYDEGAASSRSTQGVEWVRVRHRGPASQRLPQLKPLRRALRGADMVVLHSGFVPHNVVAARAARAEQVPYVVAPRGAYDPRIFTRRPYVKRLWWRAFEYPMVSRALAVHLFFDEERGNLEGLGYRGPVLVAPNGVEAPPGISWDGGSGGYLLWLGRFDPQHKGLDLLVRAVDRLPNHDRPYVRLVGPDWRGGKAAVATMVRDLGLAPWVSIEPAIYGEDKWRALASAVGFVYPSRWEGFGNSLAEAAAVGLPVLATPYPLGRLLARRKAAVLAQPTVDGLAEGLSALAKAAAMGPRARQVVLTEMSWDYVGRTWLDQTEELL
jgi:glycosyltransferase involved in cell wall biosynthesis